MNKKIMKIGGISIIIVIAVIVGILIYFNVGNDSGEIAFENDEIIPQEEISDEQLRETTIKLYYIYNNEIVEELRKVDAKELIDNPYKTAAEILFNGPTNKDYSTNIPSSVKFNNVEKRGECVVIDMSKEFVENATTDVEKQGLIISQIVNTMTQFTDINAVKILIDGDENLGFKNGNISFQQVFTNDD